MKMIMAILGCFLLSSMAFAAADLGLPKTLTQGGLYVGKIQPNEKIFWKGKELKMSPEGYFTFGLNWREKKEIQFKYVDHKGYARFPKFNVTQVKYDVQVIDGLPKKFVSPPKEILTQIKKDRALVKRRRRVNSDLLGFTQKFIWPVKGRISGHFGGHRILNGVEKSPHTGFDIAAPKGTKIVVPISGKVTMVADLYYTGNTVMIDHGHGVSTVYCHLDRVSVKLGDQLKQGDQMGTVGATGRATGPHLHWGMNWFGERLNPELMLMK
jgi:murein DD-endopeptidase MepM/ murein hydrolase activator NlpD